MTSLQSRVAPTLEPNIDASQDDRHALSPIDAGTSPNRIAILWILWEQRAFLFRCACWGLAVATLIAFLIPKSYESTTRLMPPENQSGSGMAMIAALAGKSIPGLGALAGDLLGSKSSGALFTEILFSRTVEDRIVDRFDLRKVYSDRYQEDARKDLAQHTVVSEDRKSGVITIIVTDHDPNRAAAMAKAYVEELDRLVSQVSTSSARRERIFIEQRMASVKQDLTGAEQEFSQFASKNTTLDIKEQTKAMVEGAALLQGQLIAAESELQGMEQVYTSENVRVRSVRARVEELKRQLQKMGGTDSSLLPGAAKSDELYPSIRRLPLLGVEWADLYRRMKIQETVFELLNEQYELAHIQEAKEIPVVRVIDSANVPEKKSFPPRLLTVLLLTTFSLLGGMAWVLTSRRWRLMDPDDPWKLLAQDVWHTTSEQGHRAVARMPSNGRRSSTSHESEHLEP